MFRRKHKWIRQLEADDSQESFDLGAHRRMRWRGLRRSVLIVLLVLSFVEFAGLPHVRMTYAHRSGGDLVQARYLGPTGWRDAGTAQRKRGCPLFVLIPLDRSLKDRAIDLWGRVTSSSHITQQETKQWNMVTVPRTAD